jgi:hypothetical protein
VGVRPVTFTARHVPLAALTLAACGSEHHAMSGHSTGAASAPATADHNAQDVTFAQMMIPHHQQAIVMAEQAATKASSPQVQQLASQIEQAQRPEIQKMSGWLETWGVSQPSESPMPMGDGMMSAQDMNKLDKLSRQILRPRIPADDDQASPGRHQEGQDRTGPRVLRGRQGPGGQHRDLAVRRDRHDAEATRLETMDPEVEGRL